MQWRTHDPDISNANGIFNWGIAAVMAMSLGTALSIIILATLVHHAREWIMKANI